MQQHKPGPLPLTRLMVVPLVVIALCSKPSNMLCPFLHLTMGSVGKYHGA